jgi:hypothetical protein
MTQAKQVLDIQAQDTQTTDTSGWLTKDEAGKALGVSTKTIEHYVKKGRLRQEMQSQVNKPARAVIDPKTVQAMLEDRTLRAPVPNGEFRVPFEVVEPGRLEKLLEVLLERLPPPSLPPSELSHRTVLTLDEVARLSGFGKGYLKERLEWFRCGPRGAWVCRRSELDGLV